MWTWQSMVRIAIFSWWLHCPCTMLQPPAPFSPTAVGCMSVLQRIFMVPCFLGTSTSRSGSSSSCGTIPGVHSASQGRGPQGVQHRQAIWHAAQLPTTPVSPPRS